MNADQTAAATATVGVLGFSDFERIALETVFKLGARRQPGFQRHDAGSGRPAALWLVDADVPGVLDAYRVLTRGRAQLAIFVGQARPAEAELFLEKPLRWSTALSTIETALALRTAMPAIPAAAAAPSVPEPAVAVAPEAVGAAGSPSGASNGSAGEITVRLPEDAVARQAGVANSPDALPAAGGASRGPDASPAGEASLASAPSRAPASTQQVPFEPGRVAQRRTSGAPPTRRPSAINVLVVDDSEFTREFMRRSLSRLDVALHFAESGEAAIGMSVEREYALVFLDVVMSGIDGYQVCKTLKSRRRAGKPPAVVMLTSKGSPFDRVRGTFAGCDSYLVKPVDETRLMQTIAKYLPAAVTSPAANPMPGRPAFR